jgi:hypothetical protein
MINNYFILFLVVFVFFKYLTPQNESFTNYECTHENDCFPRSYARTQEYSNVCPPSDSRLTREKIHSVQNCSRRLGSFGAPEFFNHHN